jgi:pyruvate dehydrogenase E1 component alpha subunit
MPAKFADVGEKDGDRQPIRHGGGCQSALVAPAPSAASVQDLALEVIRIRYWQHIMNEHLKEKRFNIPIHVSIGHEALAVAVNRTMGAGDQLVLTHRNMSYNLARAGQLESVYREYTLAADGVGRGVLGSMNLAQPDRGVVYTSSILGNNLPVATGLALANDVLQQPRLVIVLTGDGAMEEGTFYEGLVFARSQRLSLLFLVENNNNSMSSTIAERRCPIDVGKLCASVDIPFRSLSGNDVVEYAATLRDLRNESLAEKRPVCVEAAVRAYYQHAGPSPGWPTDPKRIDLKNGLMVEASPDDPLFVLRNRLGETAFDHLCKQVLAESRGA